MIGKGFLPYWTPPQSTHYPPLHQYLVRLEVSIHFLPLPSSIPSIMIIFTFMQSPPPIRACTPLSPRSARTPTALRPSHYPTGVRDHSPPLPAPRVGVEAPRPYQHTHKGGLPAALKNRRKFLGRKKRTKQDLIYINIKKDQTKPNLHQHFPSLSPPTIQRNIYGATIHSGGWGGGVREPIYLSPGIIFKLWTVYWELEMASVRFYSSIQRY